MATTAVGATAVMHAEGCHTHVCDAGASAFGDATRESWGLILWERFVERWWRIAEARSGYLPEHTEENPIAHNVRRAIQQTRCKRPTSGCERCRRSWAGRISPGAFLALIARTLQCPARSASRMNLEAAHLGASGCRYSSAVCTTKGWSPAGKPLKETYGNSGSVATHSKVQSNFRAGGTSWIPSLS